MGKWPPRRAKATSAVPVKRVAKRVAKQTAKRIAVRLAEGHVASPRSFQVPPELQEALQQWGPRLVQQLDAAWLRRPVSGSPLRIGTDCSGLEAPVLALDAMGIPYCHVFSSEVSAAKRRYIEANFVQAPASSRSIGWRRGNSSLRLYPDMLKRDLATLPRCDIYVCGFPCKPFSRLNTKSRAFAELAAKPFRAVLKTLAAALPAVAVLENVSGIQRYMQKVWRHLRALRWYEVLTVRLDPADMGEPVRRNRYYFLLLRADVAKDNLDARAGAMLAAGFQNPRCPLSRRLLPEGSSHLVETRSGKTHLRDALAAAQGQSFRLQRKVGRSPSAREQATFLAASTAHGSSVVNGAIDLSMSQRWARLHTDICPTVTPQARIWVCERSRFIVPLEKLLLNFVPAHALVWPAGTTDAEIEDFAGNTMHLLAAGGLAALACVLFCREGAKSRGLWMGPEGVVSFRLFSICVSNFNDHSSQGRQGHLDGAVVGPLERCCQGTPKPAAASVACSSPHGAADRR